MIVKKTPAGENLQGKCVAKCLISFQSMWEACDGVGAENNAGVEQMHTVPA